jgi:hypothetical protein
MMATSKSNCGVLLSDEEEDEEEDEDDEDDEDAAREHLLEAVEELPNRLAFR